ncbi:hypothetical protein AcV7_008677 [Taiwanofungus camphoratus]|nr:hypothetical protein AcV7_008677 [Antrodia cinnamomea]
MQAIKYYQIGGFQGHLKDPPEVLAGHFTDGNHHGIDLVLGIRPSGASYLLMPHSRYVYLFRRPPYSAPWPSERFISLSPIHFANKQELTKKLRTLSSAKKEKNGQPRDRSQANTSYTVGGEGHSPVGQSRANFEHQRVLCCVCRNEIKELSEFALRLSPALRNVSMFSLTFNTWKADVRSRTERDQDPKILDVGWTEFTLPTAFNDLAVKSSVHLVVDENSLFNNPGMKRLEFEYGTTETVEKSSLCIRLRQLFTNAEKFLASPVLLLVHDEQQTLQLLRTLGIDTLGWVHGISNLLYSDENGSRGELYDDSSRFSTLHSSHRDRPSFSRTRSSRSRSPDWSAKCKVNSRPRSPQYRAPGHSAVYVVDVRQMHHVLRQISPLNDTVPSNARDLCIQEMPPMKEEDGTSKTIHIVEKGWCAGNESRLLGRMWYTMSRGPPIDEQRALRWSSMHIKGDAQFESLNPDLSRFSSDLKGDEDSDVDPNDVVLSSRPDAPPVATSSKVSLMDADGWDDESDEDD